MIHVQAYLERVAQVVHDSSVLAAYLLAPGAAVGGVVADMDAGSRQRGALGAETNGAFCGALTLLALVQKVPFPHEVNPAVFLADSFRRPLQRKARNCVCAKKQCQSGRAHTARHGKALSDHHGYAHPPQPEGKVCLKISEFPLYSKLDFVWFFSPKLSKVKLCHHYMQEGKDTRRRVCPSAGQWSCAQSCTHL